MPKRRTQQRRRRTASQTIQDRIKDLNRSLIMKRRQLPDDFEIKRFQKKMDTSSKWLKKNGPLYHQKVEKLEEIKSSIKGMNFIKFTFSGGTKLTSQRDKLQQQIRVFDSKKQEFDHYKEWLNVADGVKQEIREMERVLASLQKELVETKHKETLRETQRKERAAKRKQKEDEIKAKAAGYDKKSRERASGLKKSVLKEQLKTSHKCPYCNDAFQDGDIHCDHIRPINKGGLSALPNLVYVCSRCNLKKKDDLLYDFCDKANFDFETIAKRLKKLKKDVG